MPSKNEFETCLRRLSTLGLSVGKPVAEEAGGGIIFFSFLNGAKVTKPSAMEIKF